MIKKTITLLLFTLFAARSFAGIIPPEWAMGVIGDGQWHGPAYIVNMQDLNQKSDMGQTFKCVYQLIGGGAIIPDFDIVTIGTLYGADQSGTLVYRVTNTKALTYSKNRTISGYTKNGDKIYEYSINLHADFRAMLVRCYWTSK